MRCVAPNERQEASPRLTSQLCLGPCCCSCRLLVKWGLPWSIYLTPVWSESHSVVSDSLPPYGMYSPLNSPGQNTGVGSLSLLQIFLTQGSNPGPPHCRRILYHLNHKGSPRVLEWVVYPFSRGSSWPRNRTGVSCIAGGFFTNWAIRKAALNTWNELNSVETLLCTGFEYQT